MAESDKIEFQGVVLDFCRDMFRVEVVMKTGTHVVMCTPSGKMRLNSIKITAGDHVHIEVSPYDLNKGRITYRVK